MSRYRPSPMNKFLYPVACPICGKDKFQVVAEIHHFTFYHVVCAGCGAQRRLPPDADGLVDALQERGVCVCNDKGQCDVCRGLNNYHCKACGKELDSVSRKDGLMYCSTRCAQDDAVAKEVLSKEGGGVL